MTGARGFAALVAGCGALTFALTACGGATGTEPRQSSRQACERAMDGIVDDLLPRIRAGETFDDADALPKPPECAGLDAQTLDDVANKVLIDRQADILDAGFAGALNTP